MVQGALVWWYNGRKGLKQGSKEESEARWCVPVCVWGGASGALVCVCMRMLGQLVARGMAKEDSDGGVVDDDGAPFLIIRTTSN